MKYETIMVAAHQTTSGKPEEESLRDLPISKLANKNDLEHLPDYNFLRTLSGDVNGIKAWAKLKGSRD